MATTKQTQQADNPFTSTTTAMIDEWFDQLKRFSRVPFLWQQAQRVRKGATPSEVVFEEDRLKLLHYINDEPPKYDTPVVFVFALVNRPYILDLLPNKSVVRHFVDAGFPTYLVDWGSPTHADRHNTLETYVDGYLVDVIDVVRKRHNVDKVSILGYCMGGTMSSMFTSLYPDRVANLMLLAAGINFNTEDGLLNLWTDEDVFDIDAFVDTFGNCPAEYLQASFLLLNPIGNMIGKPITFVERLDDEKFIDEFLTMETWLNDNIAVPGEVYRQFVKYLYQKNQLVRGELSLGNRIVNLKNIKCPVLNLMATKDDLVPCSQSEPFNDLVGSDDRKTIKFPAGHIGLAVGSRAQKQLWPEVVEWLGERS